MFSLLPCDAPSSWKMQIANKLLLDRFHVAHFMETQQPDPLRFSCFCAITLIYLIKTCYWFISLFSGESLNLKTKSQTNICTLYVWSDTSLEEMSQGVQECSPKNVSDAQTPRPLVKELHPWVKIPQHSLHMCASHFDKPTSISSAWWPKYQQAAYLHQTAGIDRRGVTRSNPGQRSEIDVSSSVFFAQNAPSAFSVSPN